METNADGIPHRIRQHTRLGADNPGQLAREERIAVAAPPDRRRQLGRDLAAGDHGELAGHFFLGQAGEPDPGHRVLAGQRGEERGQLVPSAGLGVPVRDQQHQPGRGDALGQVPQQPQGRRIGPVHVVEQQDKPGTGGRGGQELPHRLEHGEALFSEVESRRPVLGSRGDEGKVGVLELVRYEGLGDLADHRAEQPVRRAALVGHGPGPHPRHSARGGAGRRLVGQPGLADPRLAADQRDPALAPGCGFDPRVKQGQFGGSADERPRAFHAAKVRGSHQAGRPGRRESSLIKRVHPVLGGR